ncbi:3'(2'),5'-bisphosphate nucleotidase CysQ [Alcanivorax sp. JB21]|uniref:3'(2'),5'-bisphosphate nucleotidase CysQ n=1 Tax=Alcanivorax limicola TaxID=2874102 RepID=UPI001CBF65BD|nr:3'(2'),5'-bisphosphate nucleotidase CysQ [Alcanivorax limicola]MBZ2189214.1 3'(2'),5'-bisphosphate nucleotidase CysQ [Alcanivorax limicola]
MSLLRDRMALLEAVVTLAGQAGEAIRTIYERGDISVTRKADDSPLTEADMAAHHLIDAGLKALTPEVPVLSEESAAVDIAERLSWPLFWLVDPLDGTQEFIRRNGEFTVNIALIEDGVPVMGVVQVPVTGEVFLGLNTDKVTGAWHQSGHVRDAIRARSPASPVTLVASRRHGAGAVAALEDAIEARMGPVARTSMGSSLKLCRIAQGRADIYPRLAPTAEWDTAAAHAIVKAAGGEVLGPDFLPLRYQKEDLLNPHFLVTGSEPERWRFLKPLL